jgi:hypothetical protein
MNKIVLNKPMLLNDQYVVYLDSENKFSFSNKREAVDFVVKIGRQIEEAILMITEEFNSLEELYRLFFLADSDYKFKFQISNSVEFINNRLLWMTSRKGSPNHDTILFESVLNCLYELKTAFAVMQKKAGDRKDTITKRRCALKIHLIEMYNESISSVGIKPAQIKLQIKKAQ